MASISLPAHILLLFHSTKASWSKSAKYEKLSKYSQPAFTCSNLTIETLEQGVQYAQSQQWRHQIDANGVILVSSLLTLNIYHPFYQCSISIVNLD